MQFFLNRKFNNQKENHEIERIVSSKSGDITMYENLISYPVQNEGVEFDFKGGLIDSKTLELVAEAVLIRHNKPSQVKPDFNYSSDINTLPKTNATFLYGGVLFNNFGHFLLESTGRLWAYELFKKFDLYILFYVPWGIPDYKKKDNYMYQVFKGFNIPLSRIVFFTDVLQLKKVIIPQQKYGFGKCRVPDDTFIKFIKSFSIPGRLIKTNRSADKIYISRSQLPFNTGRPFGENQFEAYLQANGYLVIYPEKLTLYEQLEIYTKAKQIIFCDGGATYATVLLPNLNAAVAIIARRRDYRWNYKDVITEHFEGYKKTVLWIDEIVAQYQYGLESWDAAAEIDWHKVSITLKEEQFAATTFERIDAVNYEDIKRKELQLFIQSIQYNPLFLNYMQKLKEEYQAVPDSF
jgi:Glycosyltransferase 61